MRPRRFDIADEDRVRAASNRLRNVALDRRKATRDERQASNSSDDLYSLELVLRLRREPVRNFALCVAKDVHGETRRRANRKTGLTRLVETHEQHWRLQRE